MAVAYNAMLQAGRAIMFKLGYRPSSSYGHIAVVRFLHLAMRKEIGERLITLIDRARRKRHRVIYEETGAVSYSEAEECLRWAGEFVERVKS